MTTAIGSSKNIKTLFLPERIESIQDSCFKNGSIKKITIPKSVKSIGNDAFCGCNNLVSVTLQEGLESIGNSCF